MLELMRKEQTEFPRSMRMRSTTKDTTNSALPARGSCRKRTLHRRFLVSMLFLVLSPSQSFGQTMIDSCTMHQPGVSSDMQMAPAGALEVALDGRPLSNDAIAQFPIGTPLTMDISSDLHIKELLVRWSRLDGSDATGDISGIPLAPFCSPPTAGLLLASTTPSVSIQVDVPRTTEAILSVTAVLDDDALAFDVFVVDFVSASTAAASLKFLLLTPPPTAAPTVDGPSLKPVVQVFQFGPIRSPTRSDESSPFVGDEPTIGPATATASPTPPMVGTSTLASPLASAPPTIIAPTKHPSSTLSSVPSDTPSLTSDRSLFPTSAVNGFPTETNTPSGLSVPPSMIRSRFGSTSPSTQPDEETSSRLDRSAASSPIPSASPTFISSSPSQSPTVLPSFHPSSSPTRTPSSPPSQRPVESPSSLPSWFPTHNPSSLPSHYDPTTSPSRVYPTTPYPSTFIPPPTIAPSPGATVSPTAISLRTSNSATPPPTSNEQPSPTHGPTSPSEVPLDDSTEYSPASPDSVLISTRLLRILAFAAGFVITAGVTLAVFILYQISPEYEERNRLDRARGQSVMEIGSSYDESADDEY